MTSEERRALTHKIMGFNEYNPSDLPLKGFRIYVTLDNIKTNMECFRCDCDSDRCDIIRFYDNELVVEQNITHWKYNYSKLTDEQKKLLNI